MVVAALSPGQQLTHFLSTR